MDNLPSGTSTLLAPLCLSTGFSSYMTYNVFHSQTLGFITPTTVVRDILIWRMFLKASEFGV